jgi:hypothetical protein
MGVFTTKKAKGPQVYRERLRARAKKIIDAGLQGATIQDRSAQYPKFDIKEIEKGKILGVGGFGTVAEVVSVRNTTSTSVSNESLFAEDLEVSFEDMESRQFIAQHCTRKGGYKRYAIKMLRSDLFNNDNDERYTQGLVDVSMYSSVRY